MPEPSGRLETIWIKRAKRGPMDEQTHAQLVAGRGIVGNANQGGKRQVTLLSDRSWREVEAEVGGWVAPETRRANLFVSGIDLGESRGRVLAVGPVRIRIYGETRPCERMEEAQSGLRGALSRGWRGGCFGEVLDDGEIRVGDPVRWLEP